MGKELQPMDVSAPGQNLEAYLSSVQNIAILTPEEEKRLAEDLYYSCLLYTSPSPRDS